MTETLTASLPNDVEALIERVLKAACDRDIMLATAESCTGGLVASVLTDVEGRSHAFDRGFVTYTDQAKHQALGVSSDLLEQEGAVSEPVARAMAEGALKRSDAGVAVAITGFAGAAGADEAGLVHFAVASTVGETQHEVHRFGDIGRGPCRIACLRVALTMMEAALGRS
jgi:nicotinamide-nucleotide amidase